MMEAKAGGSLRKNPRKEKESHPDLTGTWTDTDGNKYWLSAWRNVDQNSGDVWWGLKLGDRVKEQGQQARPAKPKQDYDDVPF
jgi:hypothetical protein